MRYELSLGVIGVALSVSVFVAQGPYDRGWRYALGLAPLMVAATAIASVKLYRRVLHLRNLVALTTATRTAGTIVIRVINDAGDLAIRKTYKMQLVTDATTVQHTRDETLYSLLPVADMPPEANVISTGRSERKLVPRASYHSLVSNESETVLSKYGWSYDIRPPLAGRDDHVEFSLHLAVPGGLREAFTADGDEYFWERTSYDTTTDVFIVSPSGHELEIMDSWIIEFDGRRVQPPAEQRPRMTTGSTAFEWHLAPLSGARYACRLRFRRQP